MGYDYHAQGTIKITPPIPAPALRELQGPDLPVFCLADGVDDPEAAGPWSDMVGVWALVPADVPLDLAQPVTVGALAMRIVSKRHSIHDPLSRFAELCHRAGRRLTSEVTFRGEDGEQGVIWVDESGEVVWAETVAPGRGTSCR